MTTSTILITCPKGIPPFLAGELHSLDLPVVSELAAGVETKGTVDHAMRLNLHLRTGHRVLLLLHEFRAHTANELYQQITKTAWEEIIPDQGHVCVTSSVDTPSVNDPRFAALRCKDAIVDRIKERTGIRPDSGPERDRSVVHLYWKDDRARVYLDTTGEPLSKRAYRKIPLVAPMQETLAAAVVLATGWDGSGTFINPMCGSGTLAIEAALIGLRRAAGLLRDNFGFMHLKGFDPARWNELRVQAKKAARNGLVGKIIATDRDPDAVEAARKNATTAGVDRFIEFSVCDFAETPLGTGGGVIVLNPEYGERMGDESRLMGTYTTIGDFFKQKCAGFRGYVITGSLALAKQVKLKPARSLPFFNSGIECRLLEYELYEGSRKIKKTKKPA